MASSRDENWALNPLAEKRMPKLVSPFVLTEFTGNGMVIHEPFIGVPLV